MLLLLLEATRMILIWDGTLMMKEILRYHVREGHLQYLQKLQADLAGCNEDCDEVLPKQSAEEWLARNDSISCELGIRYPVLQAIL